MASELNNRLVDIAATLAAGMLSGRDITGSPEVVEDHIVKTAMRIARKLIAEVEKPKDD